MVEPTRPREKLYTIAWITWDFPWIPNHHGWVRQPAAEALYSLSWVDTHTLLFRNTPCRTILSLQMSLLLALWTSHTYQSKHPLKLSFLVGKMLLPSPPLLSRFTRAAEKACLGWPLSVTPVAHLSAILWSPSHHCATVSLHSCWPCSLILSLLSAFATIKPLFARLLLTALML